MDLAIDSKNNVKYVDRREYFVTQANDCYEQESHFKETVHFVASVIVRISVYK